MEGASYAMIRSAQEFLELDRSEEQAQYYRAAHDSAPIEVWNELIEKYPESRFSVAHNKTLPLEILRVLASDQDTRVRAMVAMRRKLDEPTQRLLAQDPDAGVRMCMARNKRATTVVLNLMLADPWDKIREVARERLRDDQGS
jgi:hypothetical protein